MAAQTSMVSVSLPLARELQALEKDPLELEKDPIIVLTWNSINKV
jgi:hypothetical protein